MPVTSWSTTAANNNAASPNGAPEGMAPSGVNDTIRQIMADVARESQINAVKKLNSVSGTNTITADMDPELASYAAGMLVVLTPANNNTGAATLAIDGLAALDILKADGDALVADDLIAGVPAFLLLDSGADDFFLLNPQSNDFPSGAYTPTLTNANNLSGTPTVGGAQYMRVGTVVTVSGTLLATAAGAGQCSLGVSLPIASDFSNTSQCGGGGGAVEGSAVSALFANADVTNNRITLTWTAGSAAAQALVFSATYRIL